MKTDKQITCLSDHLTSFMVLASSNNRVRVKLTTIMLKNDFFTGCFWLRKLPLGHLCWLWYSHYILVDSNHSADSNEVSYWYSLAKNNIIILCKVYASSICDETMKKILFVCMEYQENSLWVQAKLDTSAPCDSSIAGVDTVCRWYWNSHWPWG